MHTHAWEGELFFALPPPSLLPWSALVPPSGAERDSWTSSLLRWQFNILLPFAEEAGRRREEGSDWRIEGEEKPEKSDLAPPGYRGGGKKPGLNNSGGGSVKRTYIHPAVYSTLSSPAKTRISALTPSLQGSATALSLLVTREQRFRPSVV